MNGLNCSKVELISCGPAALFFVFFFCFVFFYLVPGLIEMLWISISTVDLCFGHLLCFQCDAGYQ